MRAFVFLLIAVAAPLCFGQRALDSKTIDPVAHARMMARLRELQPYRDAARQALQAHQFSKALAATDAFSSAAKRMGVDYSIVHLRAEALIGLGRSREVVQTYRSRAQVKGLRDTYTMDLAQALLGELPNARADQIRRSILANYPAEPTTILPAARTRAEKLGLVRFVRAHVASFSANDAIFGYESDLALKANPKLRLLHYQRAEFLTRSGRTAEAKLHWRAAQGLPGTLGKKAREILAGME